MIHIVCPSRYKLSTKELKQFVERLMAEKQISTRNIVNIAFVGTRKMKEIANTYKNEDVALPVLAFPYKEIDLAGEQLFGEIVLCYPQVVLLAAERGRKVDDMIKKMVEHGFMNILKSS
ncbi:MAG: rRNA maturation RNase YbeY [Patescibacteria group bacterium]